MIKYITIIFTLMLTLLSIGVAASDIDSLKKSAQSLYINSHYTDANELFSKIINFTEASSNDKKYAIRMKAVLMEKYLGEIDSAIHFYSISLDLPIKKRERKTITKKLSFLNSLGDEKEVYGIYQKIVYVNSDEKVRTKELVSFIKKYPEFRLLKEALKQCAIAGLNSEQYKEAYNAYKKIKKNYSPLDESEKKQFGLCRRMYYRFRFFQISIFVWLLLVSILIFEIHSNIKVGVKSFSKFKWPSIIWGILLFTAWLLYLLVIRHGDHNPIRVVDMLVISFVATLSISLSFYVNANSLNKFYKFTILILTSLSILASSYFVLYNRKDRISVMEDMGDQIVDILKFEMSKE